MLAESIFDTEEYRDTLATVDKDGKRVWLYPKKPSGRYFNRRKWFTALYVSVFFIGPFLKYKGEPLFLFNILGRKLILFGQVFVPQDIMLFGFATILFFVFILLFTVVFGRIWCGWLCPQTVLMEMIFRPIENWIEGDYRQQQKFNLGNKDFDYYKKKTLKHSLFIIISLLFGHTVMAYLVGVDQTSKIILEGPLQNLGTFIGLIVFSGIFYFVFSRLREQVCTTICPYGRLQAVLVNKKTSTIMYDYNRGEPRGHYKANQANTTGDCIDCGLCVQVCPMGIDIRHGTQLECTACTACIDACDHVMAKINKPLGLIDYSSKQALDTKSKYKLEGNSKFLIGLMVLILVIETALISTRQILDTNVFRVKGQLYQEQPDGRISNLYHAQIINKSHEKQTIAIEATTADTELKMVDKQKWITINEGEKKEVVFFVIRQKNKQLKTPIMLEIRSNEKVIETIKTNFMGPIN